MALQQITEGKTGQEAANIIYQNDQENAAAVAAALLIANNAAPKVDENGDSVVYGTGGKIAESNLTEDLITKIEEGKAPDNILLGIDSSAGDSIDLGPYMVNSGYFISETGQKTAVTDSVTRKFVYRLPVKIENNVTIFANYPLTDPKNDVFLRIYVNLADGTYLGSFLKDRLTDNKFLMRWANEQDCYISFYTEYIDIAKGYNYNISQSVSVTQTIIDRYIEFSDGTQYAMNDLINKNGDNSFSELTGDIWGGSDKYVHLNSDRDLVFYTESEKGKLYITKGWYDNYVLSINGKPLTFKGNVILEYINIQGVITFYINDQKTLTLNQDVDPRKIFRGVSEDVITSTEPSLLTSGPFSLGVTAKIKANGFVAIGRGTTTARYWDFIFTNYNTNNKVEASIKINGTNRALANSLKLDTWYKFIVTYNGANLNICIDGVSIASSAAGSIPTGGTFNIGSVLNLVSTLSEIKDLFMINKALTITEVTEMYNLKSPYDASFSSSVIQYWPFNSESGIVLPNEPKAVFSQKKEAVLERGAGTWESGDIANPDVVEDTLGVSGYKYIMNYSGYGTIEGDTSKKWRMCLAYSNDLENWVRDQDNPIFSPNANEGYISCNGSIVIKDGLYYHFYQRGLSGNTVSSQICLATSPDLKNWTRQNNGNPVILPTAGSYDSVACYDPCVKVYNGSFYLVYTAYGSSGASIGLATSTDGINWIKKGAIVTQSGGASEPSIVKIGSIWYISHDIYTSGASREIFGAWWDGVSQVTTEKILAKGLADWKSASVFDSSLFYKDGLLYLHYAGGNVATPNEGLNANIGISVAQV